MDMKKLGGRLRGPSPLISQWFDFCLQPAREVALARDAFAAFSPLSLTREPPPRNASHEKLKSEASKEAHTQAVKDLTALRTVGPDGALRYSPIPEGSAFLGPMSESLQEDYKWVVDSMKPEKSCASEPCVLNVEGTAPLVDLQATFVVIVIFRSGVYS